MPKLKPTVHPLKFGTQTFPVNLIQAPLAGVSSAPFRLLCTKYSHPAFTCTEMVASKALIFGKPDSQRNFTTKLPGEGPVCYQLLGNDVASMSEATKILTDLGADLIDLNCGCSVPKVRRKNAGSKLLSNPTLLYKIITAIKHNTHLPVSMKIRVDGLSKDNLNGEIAKIAAESGIDFLVVHGRNWREHYNVRCHYEDIQFFVENLNIPVIGNGDVQDLKTLQKMLATGCAGAMIGRAGIGHPWLIGQLIAEMRGETFTPPTPKQIGTIFIEQIELLAQFLNNERSAVFQARQLANYYARGLPNRKEFYAQVNVCPDLVNLRNICSNFFATGIFNL